jgi:hypothetical protein
MIVYYDQGRVPEETEVIIDNHMRMHICRRKFHKKSNNDIIEIHPIFFDQIAGWYICEGCRLILDGELLASIIGWEMDDDGRRKSGRAEEEDE